MGELNQLRQEIIEKIDSVYGDDYYYLTDSQKAEREQQAKDLQAQLKEIDELIDEL